MKLKDKIIKNRVGILIFIGVLLVVTIIIGISYAYFFNIEIKNNNTISGNINTKYYTFESSGKDAPELSQISGIASLRFCHASGFLAAADTLEGAVQAAQTAIARKES